MIQKIKKLPHKVLTGLKEYQSVLILLLILASMGLGIYNTYLIQNKLTSTPILPGSAKKLTNDDIKQILNSGAPTLGNPNAPVTVIEFADFQCPYCGKYQKEIFSQLKKKYIDTNRIQFVYMDFAFLGQESKDAAMAAKCAQDQNKFWEYHDYLFENQQGENMGAFSTDNLKEFAVEIGLEKDSFNQCLDSKKHEKTVDDQVALGRSFGVRGTPGTFINDFFINGVQGLSYFENRINAALEKK